MSDASTIQQRLTEGLAHHQAGRLAQAELLYREVLNAHPDQPDALHLLGVLYLQVGQTPRAAELIDRAVSLAPNHSNLNNLGEALRALQRHLDAIACYQRAIALNAGAVDPLGNLGLAMIELGRYDEAEKALSRASQLAPERADLHTKLCLARTRLGDPHGAVLAGRRAVELRPSFAEGWSQLANALAAAKKHDEALHAASKCIELAGNRAEALVTLGYVHERAGRTADAEAAYLRAIELNPSYSFAHRNLAALFDAMNEVDRSIPHLERALQLQPNDIEGWNNLSSLRRRRKDYTGALAAADQALRLHGGHPGAHGNRGLALLSMADYERGFPEYEWRWRCDNFTTAPRDFGKPVWDGSDPAGRTIFVHSEQGYGDTIQFVRYIPLLAERGAIVLLECSLPLLALMKSMRGPARVLPAGVKPPDFDLHVPLLSLPKLFKTSLATVPARVPYLGVEDVRLEAWKRRLEAPDARLRVGLVWAGNTKPDPLRTCPLVKLAALARAPGVTFFSLQKRENTREADSPPQGMRLIDVSDELKDFADTAAAMLNLDLIITIDTGAAHLAGALGRPTWTLLPWACDWRWLDDRDDSPWYPTMRLFRQPRRGDWASVATRVADELARRAADPLAATPSQTPDTRAST